MTTYTSPSVGNTSGTDADFRTNAKAISDALKSAGLAKTSDTGQIDFTSAARASSANVVVGYEILAFSDALQSTAPILVRVEYGSGSAAAYVLATAQVGFATDGAGNLTGQVGPKMALNGTYQNPITGNHAVSGDGSRMTGLFFKAANAQGGNLSGLVNIERTRDTSGALSSVGAVHTTIAAGYAQDNVVVRGGSSVTTEPPMCVLPTQGTTFASPNGSDNEVAVFPHHVFLPTGKRIGDKVGLVGHAVADIAAGQGAATFTATIGGVARAFRPLGRGRGANDSPTTEPINYGGNALAVANVSVAGIAMRWE